MLLLLESVTVHFGAIQSLSMDFENTMLDYKSVSLLTAMLPSVMPSANKDLGNNDKQSLLGPLTHWCLNIACFPSLPRVIHASLGLKLIFSLVL